MVESEVKRHLRLGQDFRRDKDYSLAIAQLKQALELRPDNAESHLELGRVYRENKDYAQAIEELNTAIKLDPDNSEIHLELGRAYREKKDIPKALEALNTALSHNPSDGRIYLELGRVYVEKNDFDSALKELKRAKELDLDNQEIHLELARIFRHNKEYTEAIQEFKSALKHNWNDARLHLELGWIYNDNEDYDLAVQELEQSMSMGTDTEEFHMSLGRMYRKVGEYELSVNEFRKAVEKNPDKNNLFFRNKMLNEIEISQKKEVLESKPIGLGITLTTKCNLRCRICGVWKEQWEIPVKIIEEIINLFPYLERIVWQGGEVFLSQYFERLFENASSYQNLKQTIVTNGLLIDEKWAEKLARNNVCLTYSIDAVNKETYEYITGGGAKFEDLIRSVDLVNKYRDKHNCHKDFFNKMTTILNMVMMKSNYRQLERIIDFAKEFQFDEIQLVPILGIAGPENIFVNQDQEAGKYLAEIMQKIFKKAQDYSIVLHNWLPPIAVAEKNTTEDRDKRDNHAISSCSIKKNKEVICYLPWQQMFMTPDHKLKPGCYCVQDIGDVSSKSLEEIWNGDVMQSYRRKILENDYQDLCGSACISGVIPKKELKVSRYC